MRYEIIETQIWNDEWFINLDPMKQRLFLYLLTCPHANFLGIYVLKKQYALADLRYRRPYLLTTELANLLPKVEFDTTNEVVWVTNRLKYLTRERPLNEKQNKGAIKVLKELPKTPLILSFLNYYKDTLSIPLSNPLWIPVSIPPRNPYGITDSYSYTDNKKTNPSPPLPKEEPVIHNPVDNSQENPKDKKVLVCDLINKTTKDKSFPSVKIESEEEAKARLELIKRKNKERQNSS